jgi:hypothetical protein
VLIPRPFVDRRKHGCVCHRFLVSLLHALIIAGGVPDSGNAADGAVKIAQAIENAIEESFDCSIGVQRAGCWVAAINIRCDMGLSHGIS